MLDRLGGWSSRALAGRGGGCAGAGGATEIPGEKCRCELAARALEPTDRPPSPSARPLDDPPLEMKRRWVAKDVPGMAGSVQVVEGGREGGRRPEAGAGCSISRPPQRAAAAGESRRRRRRRRRPDPPVGSQPDRPTDRIHPPSSQHIYTTMGASSSPAAKSSILTTYLDKNEQWACVASQSAARSAGRGGRCADARSLTHPRPGTTSRPRTGPSSSSRPSASRPRSSGSAAPTRGGFPPPTPPSRLATPGTPYRSRRARAELEATGSTGARDPLARGREVLTTRPSPARQRARDDAARRPTGRHLRSRPSPPPPPPPPSFFLTPGWRRREPGRNLGSTADTPSPPVPLRFDSLSQRNIANQYQDDDDSAQAALQYSVDACGVQDSKDLPTLRLLASASSSYPLG